MFIPICGVSGNNMEVVGYVPREVECDYYIPRLSTFCRNAYERKFRDGIYILVGLGNFPGHDPLFVVRWRNCKPMDVIVDETERDWRYLPSIWDKET